MASVKIDRAVLKEQAKSAMNKKLGKAIAVPLINNIMIGTVGFIISYALVFIMFYSLISTDFRSLQEYNYYSDLAAVAFVLTLYGIIFFVIILLSLLSSPLTLGMNFFFLKYSQNKKSEVGDLFSRFRITGKAIGLHFVIGIRVFLWSLLFFIPGLIAVYRYAMAPYIMAEDPNVSITDAIERSKTMMQGNKAKLFVLELSFIGWFILDSFTCGILSIVYVIPYLYTTYANFYLTLRREHFPGTTTEVDNAAPEVDFTYHPAYYQQGYPQYGQPVYPQNPQYNQPVYPQYGQQNYPQYGQPPVYGQPGNTWNRNQGTQPPANQQGSSEVSADSALAENESTGSVQSSQPLEPNKPLAPNEPLPPNDIYSSEKQTNSDESEKTDI